MPEDIYLNGSTNSIGLNLSNTAGVMALEGIPTNETRRTKFTSGFLVEWAELVDETYDCCIEIVFTPEKPMIAVPCDDEEAKLGIGLAPRLLPGETE